MTYVETWLSGGIGRRVSVEYDPMQQLFIAEAVTPGGTKIAQASAPASAKDSLNTAQVNAVRKFEATFPDDLA